MGFDRGVLPRDRDRQETFPWMGVVAAIVILGGLAAFFYFFFIHEGGLFSEDAIIQSLMQLIGG